jgi:hypothetical protein
MTFIRKNYLWCLILQLFLLLTPLITLALVDPLNSKGDLETVIIRIIKKILGLTSILALSSFLYGGFLMLVSGGSSEIIKKARGTLTWAAIGLLVIFSSYAILDFLFKAFT